MTAVRSDRHRRRERRPEPADAEPASPQRLPSATVARRGILCRPLRSLASIVHVNAVAFRRRERLSADVQVLVGAGFVVAVGYGIVTPALPGFARSFNVGITAASAVVSGFALSRVVFAPVSGRLVHRLGERLVFRIGVVVVGISSAACAYADGYLELLIYRAAGGVGSTMFTVAAASLLIKISPPGQRGRAAAAWATGWLLGNIAGPVIGGSLMGISVRAPFLIYAGLLGLAALIVGGVLRGGESQQTGSECGETPVLTFREALRIPVFRACLTSNFVDGWTVHGIRIALVPLFIVDVLGGSSTWSGAALTAFAVGTATTLALGGCLADRWGRQQAVLMGSLIVVIGTLWLGFSGSPTSALLACALSGAGTGLLTPPVDAAVADVVTAGGRSGGGRALAGFQMVGDVGAIVGPVLAGLLADLGGYSTAFVSTAVIAAASLLYWQRYPTRSSDAQGDTGGKTRSWGRPAYRGWRSNALQHVGEPLLTESAAGLDTNR